MSIAPCLQRYPQQASKHPYFIVRQSILIIQGDPYNVVAFTAFGEYLLNVYLLKILIGIHHQGSGVLVADGDPERDFIYCLAGGRRQVDRADRQLAAGLSGEAAYALGRILTDQELVI